MSIVGESRLSPVVHLTLPTNGRNLIDSNIHNNKNAFNFQIFNLKVVVLGSKGCGKTSVVRSFVNLEFSDFYRPTLDLEIYHSTTVVENGRIYDFKILDFEFLNKFPSSKQEEWDLGLINYNLMNADIYLIVFDLTSTLSFQKAQDLASQISNQNSKAKVTLCGNKYDIYLENKDKLMMSKLTPFNLSKGSRKVAAKYNNSFSSKQKIHFETTNSKKSAPASMLHLSKNNSEKSCELLAVTTKRQSRPSDLQHIAVQNARILSQSSISVDRNCGNSPCSSPFARRFTLRTTIAGTHVSGASPSRHANPRHPTSAWPRHKGRSQANIYNLAINHFVACSAKYHWRTSAVFREVIDTWERDCPITTSSSSTGSPSLFCFADAKYISRSNSEVGSKYSSLSGNHGRRMTTITTTNEENNNRYSSNNGVRPTSACCIQ